MNTNESKLTSAFCGLYCEACPTFIATANGEATDEQCKGCKSDTLGTWCSTCHLKACARDKGHEFCVECSDYPCQELMTFKEDKEYPYHDDVLEHLIMINDMGEEKWREAMDKKYRNEDGAFIDWYKELKQRNN